ncbi:MAG: helix-turn-helix domain-containing protein [Pseudomonadota bacterium]
MLLSGMIYEELSPGPAAAPLVDSYWRFRLADGAREAVSHVIVPDAMTSLSIAVAEGGTSPLLIAGPTRQAHVTSVQPGLVYGGARLKPAAAALLLGVAGVDLRGRFGPVAPPLTPPEGVKPALAGFARTGAPAALDELFAAMVAGLALDTAVAAVSEALVASCGRGQIADLAQGAGISERQLRRRFFDATGTTPKEFAGIRRLREACTQAVAHQASWAQAAAAADYADQAHLSRSVREAFAATPRRVAKYLRQIEHRFGA